MVIFVELEYIYKPSPPRSKSTATGRKPAPEQVSILNKLQYIRSRNVSLSTLQLAVAAMAIADNNRDYKPGIRGTGTIYECNNQGNNNENDDNNRDLPIIEELLLAKLQEQCFVAVDPNLDHKERGVEEAVVDKRGSDIDRYRSVPGNNFGGRPEDPIVL